MWGTISDWVMVLVAIITAYYLYKTLKSQQDVQKTQNELFRIESIRFKESIKPELRYKVSELKFHPEDKDKRILTIEVTNDSLSAALEIKSDDHPDSKYTKRILIPIDFPGRNHLVKGDKPLMLHFLLDSTEKASGWVTFSVSYQDIAATKYKQGVFCLDDSMGTEIHPFLPEVLN